MLTNHQKLLENYQQIPCLLESALQGLSDADLDLNRGEGWSIREVAHHLVDGQSLFAMCIKALVGTDGIELPMTWYFAISQDEWACRWAYAQRPLCPSLEAYRCGINEIADLLVHCPDAWTHAGYVTWPGQTERTTMSIEAIVDLVYRHACAHIEEDILLIRKLYSK
jgi:hypothetical protein